MAVKHSAASAVGFLAFGTSPTHQANVFEDQFGREYIGCRDPHRRTTPK